MNSTRLPPSACSSCGYVADAATHANGNAAPKVGDLTCCLRCGTLHEFDEAFRLKACELASLPPETQDEVRHVQSMIAKLAEGGAR
jgi:hypothetical protein